MIITDFERWTSTCRLALDAPADQEADLLPTALQALEEMLAAAEQAANRFDPASELSQLNARLPVQGEISWALAELVQAALDAYRLTDGAFDPRVQAPVPGISFSAEGQVLAAVPSLVQQVQLYGKQLNLEAALDLTALLKAWAADRAAAKIAQITGVPTLVSLGGDIATAGAQEGTAWSVTVQDLETDPASTLEIINNGAIATSSTQKRRWVKDGGAWHHIVNPATGLSAEPYLKTASIIAGSAAEANALATAAIVWGKGAARKLSDYPNPYRLVTADGAVHTNNWPGVPA